MTGGDPSDADPKRAQRIVVMGVSGCGKTTLGRNLAAALGLPFIEGDDLHPRRNIERMAAGIALTDADRQGWLEAIAQRLHEAHAREQGLVVACSALKRSYRDLLRSSAPDLLFVHLYGTPELLAQRLRSRRGHYMPASLLQSQLETLEPPDDDEAAVQLDVAQPADTVLASTLQSLHTVNRGAS